jgi:hypothetical protein
MENANDNANRQEKFTRRQVPALLIESSPPANGLFYWILASPMILFVGWFWVDLFAYFDPLPWYWLDFILGVIIYIFLILLPLGYGAHRLVTSLPKLFQNAGWDVQPLEDVRPEEMYSVNYLYTGVERAPTTWDRIWMRAAQGWVYIEIAAILIGAIAIIPLFFSAVEFGFGSR